MTTASMSYIVTVSPTVSLVNTPAILEIYYIAANGNLIRDTNCSVSTEQWNFGYTGTTGNQYYCGAKEIESNWPVSVQVLENNSQVAFNNNNLSPTVLAGATGTI